MDNEKGLKDFVNRKEIMTSENGPFDRLKQIAEERRKDVMANGYMELYMRIEKAAQKHRNNGGKYSLSHYVGAAMSACKELLETGVGKEMITGKSLASYFRSIEIDGIPVYRDTVTIPRTDAQ